MTRQELIKIAAAEIGVKEFPSNTNKVKYNNWFYGLEVSGSRYPWCAVFVSWCFRSESGLIKKSASCSEMVRWFKKNNQWYTKNPQVGDLVFFNYSHPNALADHVGIVVKTNPNGTITTIEGNTSITSQDNGGCVMERIRASQIVGYGRPKYSNSDTVSNAVNVANYPSLAKGAKGAWVVLLQNCLIAHGYPVGPDGADGDFGTNTLNALVRFQKDNALTVNGICSRQVWEKLS